MDPQYTRFLVEELLENKIGFKPTYGNTLMGLGPKHKPFTPEDKFSITYHAPQPRAVLRVVNPDTDDLVEYEEWGGRGIDHFDEGIFYAALSRARRGYPPTTH
ncbi:MAG: hypothetical protein Ct9H300mP7_1270 [Verrucomicrobiota bacterium]|nr:MAG: hypothetical protein Ct9H300mP7_1270 [Verrucomicrobiota bacterium]